MSIIQTLPPAPRRELPAPGRARERYRRSLRERVALMFGIISLATAITVAAAFAGIVPVTTGKPQTVPLAATPADLVCSGPETLVAPDGGDAVSTGGRQSARAVLAVGTAPASKATASNATATFDRLSVRSSQDSAKSAVGRGAMSAKSDTLDLSTKLPKKAGAFLLQADPTTAHGQSGSALTAAAQVGLATSGDLRGLAATPCGPAVTDAWVVGGSTRTGERTRLLLANPMSSPAVVDITLLGPDGPVEAPNADGLVVPPGEQIAVALDALAPGLDMVATHVVARSGRVAVTTFDTVLRGLVAGGTDDVVPSAAPARRLVVPGVALTTLHGAGSSVVRIAVPGTEDAVVKVTMLGAEGPVVLPGGVLAVPAGSVAQVKLDGIDGVTQGHYAVLVEADLPVVAAVRLGRGVAGSEKAGTKAALGLNVPPSEFAWAAATPALGSDSSKPDDGVLVAVPALGVVGAVGPDVRLDLGTTATGDLDLAIRVADASGGLGDEQAVTVPARGSTSVLLPRGASAVMLPQQAGVHAALVIAGADDAGPLLSVLAIGPSITLGHGTLESRPDPRLGLELSRPGSGDRPAQE